MSTVNIQKPSKLNQLQHVLPEGLPVNSDWLQNQGYSRQLIARYVQSGWLSSPARTVYRRESLLLNQNAWEPAVISLQNLLKLPLTVGGRTALELHGLTHYLSQVTSEVHLYGSESLPTWLNKLPLKQRFVFHSTSLFKSTSGRSKKNKEYQRANFEQHKWEGLEWTMLISTPERAILEVLDELPTNESFHQADMLMEGLSNLRPAFLNMVLADCRSVKTKRLFLWFAQRHNHAWFKGVETEKIDLGQGKRMIVAGGRLDRQYLITVPREFANDRERAI